MPHEDFPALITDKHVVKKMINNSWYTRNGVTRFITRHQRRARFRCVPQTVWLHLGLALNRQPHLGPGLLVLFHFFEWHACYDKTRQALGPWWAQAYSCACFGCNPPLTNSYRNTTMQFQRLKKIFHGTLISFWATYEKVLACSSKVERKQAR